MCEYLLIVSQPGLAFLTLFLSRVEVIKQSSSSGTEPSDVPTAEDFEQWYVDVMSYLGFFPAQWLNNS